MYKLNSCTAFFLFVGEKQNSVNQLTRLLLFMDGTWGKWWNFN